MISEKEWEYHTKSKRGYAREDEESLIDKNFKEEKVFYPIVIQSSYGTFDSDIKSLTGETVFLIRQQGLTVKTYWCSIVNDNGGRCNQAAFSNEVKKLSTSGWEVASIDRAREVLDPQYKFKRK